MGVILAWLIKHPATIAFSLLALTAAASSALAKHEMTVNKELRAQIQQAQSTISQMDSDIKTGEKIANDYQSKITSLNRAAAARRVRSSACIVPSGAAASGDHGSASAGKPVGQNGISTQFLDDYAAEAEKYRLQLIGCQDYVTQVCQGH